MTLTTKRKCSINEEVETNYFTPQDRSFFTSIVKDLTKTKWASHFVHPVNEETPGTTDNTKVIKEPMDLGTITTELQQDKYTSREQCIRDAQLIFDNCYLANDATSKVCYDARKLEAKFKKGLLRMPPKCQKVLNHEHIELMPADQWKRCEAIVKEMKRPKYEVFTYPFVAPVDPITCGALDYFDVIEHPMDMSTYENKLYSFEYASEDELYSDIRLMLENCFKYNPPGHEIRKNASEFQKVFEEKWFYLHNGTTRNNSKALSESPTQQKQPKKRKMLSDSKEQSEQYQEQYHHTESASVPQLSPMVLSSMSQASTSSTSSTESIAISIPMQEDNLDFVSSSLNNIFPRVALPLSSSFPDSRTPAAQRPLQLLDNTYSAEGKKKPLEKRPAPMCLQIQRDSKRKDLVSNKEVVFKKQQRKSSTQGLSIASTTSALNMRRKPYQRPQQKKMNDGFLSLDFLVDEIQKKNEKQVKLVEQKPQENQEHIRKQMDEKINEKRKDRVQELEKKPAENLSKPGWRAARFERKEMSSDPDWSALKNYQYHTMNYRELPMPGFVMNNGGIDRLLQLKEEFLKKAESLKKAQTTKQDG